MPDPSALALAEAAAHAARRVDGVVELDGGALGSFSTYGDGKRCTGVTIADGEGGTGRVVRLRLVAAYGTLLPELGAQVRAGVQLALDQLLGGAPVVVDVEITDLSTSPA